MGWEDVFKLSMGIPIKVFGKDSSSENLAAGDEKRLAMFNPLTSFLFCHHLGRTLLSLCYLGAEMVITETQI